MLIWELHFLPVMCYTGRIMSLHQVLNGVVTTETAAETVAPAEVLIMSSAFPAGFLSL